MTFNLTLTLAFGGLIGSLITLIIKGFIEEGQKKRENKRVIQKIYFERKLYSAEKAINSWYTLKTLLTTAVHSIKAGEKIEDFGYYGFEETFSKISSAITKIDEALAEGGNSIILYFDIDKVQNWSVEDVQGFFKELSAIHELMYEVNFYQSALQNETEQLKKERIEAHIESLLPKLKDKLTVLGGYFEKMELYYKGAIKTLRHELYADVK